MAGTSKTKMDRLLRVLDDNKLHEFRHLRDDVVSILKDHPDLSGEIPAVHSIKARTKSRESLKKKIIKKISNGESITSKNFFEKITDISGVRVLHLYQKQFEIIHKVICDTLDKGHWTLFEKPKAYTWDPESSAFFKSLDIEVKYNPRYYTSVHYVIKPNTSSHITCEIQVRTLFEEIWGEIDHAINYPVETGSVPCWEQIRVLAKLVATGGRLADSIIKSHEVFAEEISVVSKDKKPLSKRKSIAKRN